MSTFQDLARLLLLSALLAAPLAWAKPLSKPLAVGAMMGAPTGLTAKLWLSPERAIDFGLAYSLNSSLLVQAHSLHHLEALDANLPLKQTRPYWGWGATLHLSGFEKNKNQAGLGARFPLGLEWSPSRLSFFAEVAPGMGILPSTLVFFEGSLRGPLPSSVEHLPASRECPERHNFEPTLAMTVYRKRYVCWG
jgi:hypothetical protein